MTVPAQVGGLPRGAILNLKRKNGEGIWLEAGGRTILHGHPAPSCRD